MVMSLEKERGTRLQIYVRVLAHLRISASILIVLSNL